MHGHKSSLRVERRSGCVERAHGRSDAARCLAIRVNASSTRPTGHGRDAFFRRGDYRSRRTAPRALVKRFNLRVICAIRASQGTNAREAHARSSMMWCRGLFSTSSFDLEHRRVRHRITVYDTEIQHPTQARDGIRAWETEKTLSAAQSDRLALEPPCLQHASF